MADKIGSEEIDWRDVDWQEVGFRLRYAMEQAATAFERFAAVYAASVRAEVDRRNATRRVDSERRESAYAEWKSRREADHG